jgi:hypothetical protein
MLGCLLSTLLAACASEGPPPESAIASQAKTPAASASAPAPNAAAPSAAPSETVAGPLPSAAASASASAPHVDPPAPVVFDFGMQPRALTEVERASVIDIAMKHISSKRVTLLTSSPGAANANAWGKLLRDYLVSGGIQEEALTIKACVSPDARVRSFLVDGEVGCEAVPVK